MLEVIADVLYLALLLSPIHPRSHGCDLIYDSHLVTVGELFVFQLILQIFDLECLLLQIHISTLSLSTSSSL